MRSDLFLSKVKGQMMGQIDAGPMPDYNVMMGFKKLPTRASKMASRCKTRLTSLRHDMTSHDVMTNMGIVEYQYQYTYQVSLRYLE